MTRMIENTPMVMPTIVRAARNLFAPNALNAMFRISLNCMIRIGVMEQGSDGVLLTALLRYSNTPLLHHSYRNAVTGSSRDAVHAGANPEINPVMTDTTMLITTNPVENWVGKDGKAMPMRKHMAKAKPSPIIPPSKQRAVDSIKN